MAKGPRHKEPIIVFDMMTADNVKNAVLGHPIGTLVTGE